MTAPDEPSIDGAAPQQLHGISPAMQEVRRELTLAGRHRAPVLITGEPGVGKASAAHLLHWHRNHGDDAPFVAVDCRASSEGAFGKVLFQVAGTAAQAHTRGPDQGQHGTVFLAHLSQMSATRQALLLRSLESTTRGSCVIASGPSDLFERVVSNQFSERLFYRLNTLHIVIPPLRARQDDVPVLLRYFFHSYSRPGLVLPQLSQAALRCFVHHTWPGNVSELKHLVQQLTQRRPGQVVQPADLPPGVRLQVA